MRFGATTARTQLESLAVSMTTTVESNNDFTFHPHHIAGWLPREGDRRCAHYQTVPAGGAVSRDTLQVNKHVFEKFHLRTEKKKKKKKVTVSLEGIQSLSALPSDKFSIRAHRAGKHWGNNKLLSCRVAVGSGPESTSVTAVSPEKADRTAPSFSPQENPPHHTIHYTTPHNTHYTTQYTPRLHLEQQEKSQLFRFRRKQLFNGVLQWRSAKCWRTGRQNTSGVFNHLSSFFFFFLFRQYGGELKYFPNRIFWESVCRVQIVHTRSQDRTEEFARKQVNPNEGSQVC